MTSRTNNLFDLRDRHTNLSLIPTEKRVKLAFNAQNILPITEDMSEIKIVFSKLQVATSAHVVVHFNPLQGQSTAQSTSTVLNPLNIQNVTSTSGTILFMGSDVNQITGQITLKRTKSADLTKDIWVVFGSHFYENDITYQTYTTGRFETSSQFPLVRFVILTSDASPNIFGDMWVFYKNE